MPQRAADSADDMRLREVHAVDAIADPVRHRVSFIAVGVRASVHSDADNGIHGTIDARVVRIEVPVAKIKLSVRIHFVHKQVWLFHVAGAMAVLNPNRTRTSGGEAADGRVHVGSQELAAAGIILGLFDPGHFVVAHARNAFHVVNKQDFGMVRCRLRDEIAADEKKREEKDAQPTHG